MKVALNMLREYVDINITNEEYEKQMIACGNGIESITSISDNLTGVVVGRVLSVAKVEGSDHLNLCKVEVGAEEPLQIVCGAPNVKEGILVPVALAGAVLPGGFKIKKGKLRGIVSEGMLCSSTELKVPVELYPSVGDAGLLVFNEEYPVGSDVKPILGIDDVTVDFEILANRPDCLSAIGLARETAAVLEKPFNAPNCTVIEKGGDIHQEIKITVEDSTLCPRYIGRVVKNVRIGTSPMWLRKYLHGAGLRSINNVVDITNYIMLEYGHPMHAFDLDMVKGKEIIVRTAKENEKLTTLDDVERTLRTQDLVICDSEGATGIAGVMGGEESEITANTKNIVFECACFDRTSIRLTARAQGMRTESSGRFERGVCAKTVKEAMDRACHLVNELDCGDVVSGEIDIYPNPKETQVLTVSVNRIQKRAGVLIPKEDMVRILQNLHFEVLVNEDELTLTVPDFREDIDGEADICEEVLRMYGYHHIPATALRGETTQGSINPMLGMQRKLGNILQGFGSLEIMNYSFMSLKALEKLDLPSEDWRTRPMPILNPLGEDTAVMRPTLVCDMLKTLAFNMNHSTPSAKLYEMAAIFNPHKKTDEGLPTETQMLCIGCYGAEEDFYSIRSMVETLFNAQGVTTTLQVGADNYYHPGRSVTFVSGDAVIAKVGEIHPSVCERFDMPMRALVAEIDLEQVFALQAPMGELKALPRFPAITRDLALVMDEKVNVGPLFDAMKTAGGKLLEQIELFDVYRGVQIGETNKSVAFAMVFRANDRSLTDAEIQKIIDKMLKIASENFNAILRA